MTDIDIPGWLIDFLVFMAGLFIFVVGAVILLLVIVYVVDVTQNRNAIQRNYPVIGHLRPVLMELGKFFRQYFYMADREERPFNRAQRTWVYRAAENAESTIPFGTTRLLEPEGTVTFVNSAYPDLSDVDTESPSLVIGPTAANPYMAASYFNISGMSYGSISKVAIRALSHGARRAGCWLNTGEGGLAPYHLEGGCDLVFQIGTAKYGVRDKDGRLDDGLLQKVAAHEEVKMFELKLAQGAKPGKGGILPGAKVTREIAEIRHIPAGEDSISPNRHPEIESVDDLLDMIGHIRRVTGKPAGIKTVIGDETWIRELCAKIRERGPDDAPDFITVDSADGGSGAAPQPLMDYVGMTIFEALPIVVDCLDEHNLRGRVRVIASGKLILPGVVAWALATGADFVTSARGFMFAVGCIQAMRCNKNTCPTGVTTHNKRLMRALDPDVKQEGVQHYVENMRHQVNMIAHSCGVPEPRQLRRRHCRIALGNGRTRPLTDMFPDFRADV